MCSTVDDRNGKIGLRDQWGVGMYHQPWLLVQNRVRGKGGRELDKFRGVEPPVDDDFGSEAWIGSVTKMVNPVKDEPNYGCSEVILPDGTCKFLFEIIEENPQQILGHAHMEKNGTDLGMLVKYLDTSRSFSLQCHPTRSWAKEMWGSDYGKEESWYVLGTREDAEEPAHVLLGFKEGVTRELWEKYYFADDVKALESLCHKIPVQAGDMYFVECGCPHKVGAGCFMIEVQEPSDLTSMAFRIEEYARRVKWDRPYTREEEMLYDKRLLGTYIYEGYSYEENLRRRRVPPKIFRKGDSKLSFRPILLCEFRKIFDNFFH